MASQSLSILTISTSSSSSHSNIKSGKSFLSSSSVAFPLNSKPDWLVNSMLGNQFSFKLTNSRLSFHKNHCLALRKISSNLNTTDKALKWSARAIKSYQFAILEARKLRYSKTGTESLLMGILVEGTSLASRFLRANGVTLFKVQDETIKLLGRGDVHFYPPQYLPLTEPAKRALDYAVDEKLKSGTSGEITTTHLLLGVWSEKEFAGHKIMETLGVNDEKIAELAKSKDEDYVLSHIEGNKMLKM
ncbi:hypothetical protein AQUCO_01300577v1 [Aquilegia coerulea]|uniref:Clp R domain-containing protein n=1 Tax=Aquilegia coerulea TaxID=218851 RepID=A0A2G5E2H3_AQUCA|nr:hypothetical protein AQUCO_01300577v1 [Aquilegia coerulea]